MQVSVIVLTYNPDAQKLCSTLQGILCQTDISFELILADDGSVQPQTALAEDFLLSKSFTNYKIVANPKNQGTLQNCLSGLSVASGAYVFFTSPGDILFDSHVLADFYRFAQLNGTPLCFGNALHYRPGSPLPVLTYPYTTPANPEIYAASRPAFFRKACYCDRSWITGAVFFRERNFAQKYFSAIATTSVYTEDTPSTLFAIADHIPPVYYNRNMVFYESGGVSTGGNSKWIALIDKDIRSSIQLLKQQLPNDPFVDVAYINACTEGRWKRLLSKLRHPLILLCSYWAKVFFPKTPVLCTSSDLHRLKDLLPEKSE